MSSLLCPMRASYVPRNEALLLNLRSHFISQIDGYDPQRNDEEERPARLTEKIHLPWLHPRLCEPSCVRCEQQANDNRSLY